jgi:hypothetical protein
MCIKIITCIGSFLALILAVLVLVKVDKKGNCGESYSFLFPQPDKRNLKGSIECAYALDGSNSAHCNEWLKSHRAGKLCKTNDGCYPNSFGKVYCENALKCCNQIATCEGGNDCRDPKYTPTKKNNLMYDSDLYLDQ